ncbi:MAG: PilZ domain-containing protein [Candidatus Wallbacteria bacterium]
MAEDQNTTSFEITNESSLQKYLGKGQVIEVEVKLGLFAGQYKSKVLTFNDKNISFAVPAVGNKLIHLWDKTVCHINYMRSDGMYTFMTRIVKSEIYPNPILQALVPPKIEKIQRRRYVRVDVKLAIKMRRFHEDVPYDSQPEPFFEATTVNISAGGLRADSPKHKLEMGEVYEFEFTLDNYKYQNVLGEIVRAAEMKNAQGALLTNPDGSQMYNYGVNFIQIHRVQKEKIISYVFKREREMIASGMK